MKKIELTQGKLALVDDRDHDGLCGYRWHAENKGERWYAYRTERTKTGKKRIYMHHAIVGRKIGKEIDHRNGNGLDNRRANLRRATRQENMRNSRLRKDNRSGWKGVFWSKQKRKWRSIIGLGRRQYKHLGFYNEGEEAARAYDEAARALFGEFAKTNEDMGLLESRGKGTKAQRGRGEK